MTYILAEQRDADCALAFQLYRKYIEGFRYKFPDDVLKLIEGKDWFNPDSSVCPHDCDVRAVFVNIANDFESSIKIELSKSDGSIGPVISYGGVIDFNIAMPTPKLSVPVWRYDEFLYFDPYHEFDLKQKMFQHKIQFVGGACWQIWANSIAIAVGSG